jgi:hypothetical protein
MRLPYLSESVELPISLDALWGPGLFTLSLEGLRPASTQALCLPQSTDRPRILATL